MELSVAKKVALITAFSSVAEVHRRTLEALFRGTIELRCYSYDVVNINSPIEADLFVISIYQIYLNLKQFIPKDAKAIIISNTITEEQYQRIAQLPAQERARDARLWIGTTFCASFTEERMRSSRPAGISRMERVAARRVERMPFMMDAHRAHPDTWRLTAALVTSSSSS